MAEEIVFDVQKDIGGFERTVMVDRFRVVGISFTRTALQEAENRVTLGITLEHPETGWIHSITLEGAEAKTLAQQMNTGNFSTKSLHTRILEKLLADGKLPAGTISGSPE